MRRLSKSHAGWLLAVAVWLLGLPLAVGQEILTYDYTSSGGTRHRYTYYMGTDEHGFEIRVKHGTETWWTPTGFMYSQSEWMDGLQHGCANDQILRPFFAENWVTLRDIGSSKGSRRSVTRAKEERAKARRETAASAGAAPVRGEAAGGQAVPGGRLPGGAGGRGTWGWAQHAERLGTAVSRRGRGGAATPGGSAWSSSGECGGEAEGR